MKVLTVRQPQAGLIAIKRKCIEWRPKPTKHRGAIVIHAGKAWSMAQDAFLFSMGKNYNQVSSFAMGFALDPALGVTLCMVDIVDCVPYAELESAGRISNFERLVGLALPGYYGWVLENPRPIARVAVRGQLGLWNIADELIQTA